MTRLYAYIIGAVVVFAAFAGLTALMYKYKGDAVAAEAEAARIRTQLQLAVAVNKDNLQTIDAMKAQALADDKAAADLQAELDVSNQTQLQMALKITALRSGNKDVEDFLDQPIPAELCRLYGCAEAGSPGSN